LLGVATRTIYRHLEREALEAADREHVEAGNPG
jgi:hypothetical protein